MIREQPDRRHRLADETGQGLAMRRRLSGWGALGLFLVAACGDGAADDAGPVGGGEGPQLVISVRGAAVAVARIPPRPVRAGTGFTFRVSFRQIPAGAGLDIFVVRNVERQDPGEYGEVGSVTLEPVAIQGSGSVEIVFTGAAASAPADALTFRPVAPGEYRLLVTVHDPMVPIAPMIEPPPSRIVAEYRSEPFRIIAD